MATFAYTAVDPSGRKRTGTIDAADQQAAIRMVSGEGRYVLEIEEAAQAEDRARRQRVKRIAGKKRGMSRADLALFTRRLSDLSAAGLPLDRVLEVLAEQTESQKLSDACLASLDEVRKGMPVSDSLASTSRIFPRIFTQTLSAGEASGQFAEAATRLADMQEREAARRSQVISALVYPAVLSLASVFVVIFLIAFVVPRLATVFEGQGRELPAPTQALLAMTGFVTGNWVLLLALIGGGAVFLRFWFATPGGSLVRDRILLSLPLIGPVTEKATISRYARVLGFLAARPETACSRLGARSSSKRSGKAAPSPKPCGRRATFRRS
jgi:type II secretory pathway component PulF